MWQLGMDFALYADLFKRKGDKSKAKEKLARGIDILKECGADGWVDKYEDIEANYFMYLLQIISTGKIKPSDWFSLDLV